jgi:uncharacterized membrane protein YuzA (DUF378 family)
MKVLDIIVTVLLVIGALNWGWVGFFGYNPVWAIFGETAAWTRGLYALVGLSGLYEAYSFTVGYNELHHRWCDLSTAGGH